MPHFGRFLGKVAVVACFSGAAAVQGVAAQDVDPAPSSAAVPKHLVAHRAKVAWTIHRSVVPVASRLAPEPAAITPVAADGGDAAVPIRP